MLIRVVDIGSNSVKATLYSVRDGRHETLAKDKLEYALGDAVFADGSIPSNGLDKVAQFINRQPASFDGEKTQFTFVVATSAVRSAQNRDEAVREWAAKTGCDIRVLTGAEESFLIHHGIVSQAHVKDDAWVKSIDIGGGSAEISVSQGLQYRFGKSYELGAIRLTSRFLDGKALSLDKLTALRGEVEKQLKQSSLPEPWPTDRAFGSSGNLRAIAKMVGELRGPGLAKILPDITPGALEDLLEIALGRTPPQLKGLFDINLERARIIVAAIVVLLASMRNLGIRHLEVTDSGLREGVIQFWGRHGHLQLPV